MPKKKRRTNSTAMINVDANYIKGCIRERNGVMDRISEDMGYNETYLSFNLSKNRQCLLPVVLDYLVMNWGVDKERALRTSECEVEDSIDLKLLSKKMDIMLEKYETLHRSFYEVQKALVEIKNLWK